MPELPVEWAALAHKMLGFKVPLEVFYATDMRCAKPPSIKGDARPWICNREIFVNRKEREANAILDTKNY